MKYIVLILNVVYVYLVLHALYAGVTNFMAFAKPALLGLLILLVLNHFFLESGGGHH
jgi:hypothetical protein